MFPKCVIFDFDGVITDSVKRNFQLLRRVSKKFGVNVPNVESKRYIGNRTVELLTKLCGRSRIDVYKKIVAEVREKRDKEALNHKTITGLRELLNFLKRNGVIIAIATSNTRPLVEAYLKEKRIVNYFKFMITGTEFSGSKDEKVLLGFLKKIKINPNESIVIEDAPKGVIAAKAAGCKVFGMRTYLSKKDLGMADRTFKNHNEIKRFLIGLK